MNMTNDSRLIYKGEIYDAINQFSFDLDFYRKWCGMRKGPILEVCSGTGRLTIPLRKAGLDITGLDLSDSMIEMARTKAAAENIDMTFLKGDMRKFELNKKYSIIFIPFNSLQDISTVEDVEATLACVRAHLAPDGLFLFDVFNPSIYLMVERERESTEAFNFRTADGKRIIVRETCRYHASSQVNKVRWHFDIEGVESVEEFGMRCYYPLELEVLLKHNGFRVLQKFGTFGEEPFGEESKKQIFVCSLQA